MKVALVLNGEPPDHDDLKLLDACQAIVCADGAARFLLAASRPPTVIVGDLDSLDEETYKWADALDVPVEPHPKDKDWTDGELALEKALGLQPTSLLIIGGHGKRTAMFLANLRLLRRCHREGLDAVMVGNHESLRFVSAGHDLSLAGRTGQTLNILALEGHAIVSLEGTEFDVKLLRLDPERARGVSNRIKTDGSKVVVHEGAALVILEQRRERE